MTDPHELTPLRWQRTKNAWTRLTWPLQRRLGKLPAHAAPTDIGGVDDEGWVIEGCHATGKRLSLREAMQRPRLPPDRRPR